MEHRNSRTGVSWETFGRGAQHAACHAPSGGQQDNDTDESLTMQSCTLARTQEASAHKDKQPSMSQRARATGAAAAAACARIGRCTAPSTALINARAVWYTNRPTYCVQLASRDPSYESLVQDSMPSVSSLLRNGRCRCAARPDPIRASRPGSLPGSPSIDVATRPPYASHGLL